ncbi:hypothetical protein FR932_11745 [Moritella marina ATCC 15381]|uniref:Uncharacterized protein n=1 Tax=Moritella marina ATCC 15381 TaxID=1202962 RepID=A0A5J6WN63_MORMI|nr:hypothetical protein [Moritella marina]QFI38470.1 hypothetical protein FR932_11745 [Moritella marina ATCC 15381]
MDKFENKRIVERKLTLASNEQQQTEVTIDELTAQIKRMTDYVQQHSQSNTAAVHKTLKATMRYRDSLVASLNRESSATKPIA